MALEDQNITTASTVFDEETAVFFVEQLVVVAVENK